MKRINAVRVVKIIDSDGDSSWIGEYSDTPGKFAVNCKKHNSPSDYRYFNSANADNKKDAVADFQRMEAFNRGEWEFVGVRAECQIATGGVGAWQSNFLQSAGVYGIESDSGADYFAEMQQEQLNDLRSVLTELGFTSDEIDAAFANVETKAEPIALPTRDKFRMVDA